MRTHAEQWQRRWRGPRSLIALGAVALAALACVTLTPHRAGAIRGGDTGWGEQVNDVAMPVVDGSAANSPLWVARVRSGRSVCSGVVVTAYWALTARHCLDGSVRPGGAPEPAGVTLSADGSNGNTRVIGMDAFGDQTTFGVDEVFWRADSDIALLRLSDPFQLRVEAGYAREVHATLPFGGSKPVDGDTAVLYGFGPCGDCWVGAAGQEIEWAAPRPDSAGGAAWQGTPRDAYVHYGDAEVRYAASRAEDGDSGGPLIYQGRVIGIDSGGNPEIDGQEFIANVYFQLDWIGEAMGL